jgi:hypothetical protein
VEFLLHFKPSRQRRLKKAAVPFPSINLPDTEIGNRRKAQKTLWTQHANGLRCSACFNFLEALASHPLNQEG